MNNGLRHKPAAAVAAALVIVMTSVACAGPRPPATSIPVVQATTQAVPTSAGQLAPTVAATAANTQATPTNAGEATATAATTAAATTAATEGAAVATSVPLLGSLDVKSVTSYTDNEKSFHVAGLVVNGTGQPVNNIQLSLTLTDRGGHSVLPAAGGVASGPAISVTISPLTDFLAPGESAPFRYDQPLGGQDTSGWQPKVQVAGSATPADLSRARVIVAHQQMAVSSDGTLYLTGELVNTGDQPAKIRGLAGALLSGPDTVIAAGASADHAGLLAPADDPAGGDHTPFVISLPGPIKAEATPAIYVDGVTARPADLQMAAAVHYQAANSFVDPDHGLHLVVTVTNSSTLTVTTQLVAGLYDQAGHVVAASAARLPLALAPGASLPAAFNSFSLANGNADLFSKVVSSTVQIDPAATITNSAAFVTLQASDVTTNTNGGGITIAGDLVNTTLSPVMTATVVVALLDPAGKLVATDYTSIAAATSDGLLAPQAKLPWNIHTQLPAGLDPGSLTFQTFVQASVPQ